MIDLARDAQMRMRRAAALKGSLWVGGLGLLAGACVARLLIHLLPPIGGDVAKAKALGIVSVSVLAGYSKSAESLGYLLALISAITSAVVIWIIWSIYAGRRGDPAAPPLPWITPRTKILELTIIALLAFGLFARFWNGKAATFSSWSVLSEEGEMLAWVDAVLRGRALSRDVFCLYGPLSVWLVAALFTIFHPSLGLWRTWIFALNAPALIGTYLLLRGTVRTKAAATAGTIAVALLCSQPIPAMSWSLSRVGFGLAALGALTRALDRRTKGWSVATGALVGAALLYSQEVGIACVITVGVALLLQPTDRRAGITWTLVGAALVLFPAIVYLAATNALGPTIQNLFLFPRTRMLGYAASPFPRFAPNGESLRAYFIPAVLVVSAFSTITKLLRGLRDARVITEAALFVFGVLLFGAALSRPDDPHLAFAAPPAIVLLTSLLEDACFAFRSANHGIAAAVGLVLGLAALAPWSPWVGETVRSLIAPPVGRTLALPRGGSALLPDDFARDLEEITRAIQSRTALDEPIWVYPNEALLYFLADRPQATHFPLVLFAVTRQQRQELVADLERTRPRWAVMYRDAPQIDAIPYDVALPEVVDYLNANYVVDSNVGAFALLRRTESTPQP